MRTVTAALAALVLAGAIAAPAAAITADRFSFNGVNEHVFSCGVEERTLIEGEGADYFDAEGNWLWTALRFRNDGTFTDPVSGAVVPAKGRQVLTVRGSEVRSRGQGVFIRVPGEGVVLHDVGRLVFDIETGETLFQSARALPFDEASEAAADEAVCSLFD